MNQKQKTMLKRIVAAAIVYIAAAAAKKMNVFAGMPQPWTELVVFLIPYLIIGWDIVYKAFRGIKNGQVFDENFLMTVATRLEALPGWWNGYYTLWRTVSSGYRWKRVYGGI